MKIVGVIPARYKSSRFPGKPLADICGKPMIWWVYNQAVKVTEFDSVYVATDDEKIKSVCEQLDINVIMTSDKHPTGTDRVAEVAEKIPADLYVNIQGDEPIIDPNEIKEVIGIFENTDVYFGSLRKEITDIDEIAAKSTVKVVVDKNDNALFFSRNIIPSNIKDNTYSRIFRHVGIYAYRKDFLLEFIKLPQSELELGEGIEPLRALENGYKICVKETKYDSIGVDYPEHIKIVESEIQKRNLKSR